ncbi:MAG: hypothetical protein H7177_02580 [Rhizobacter sp.]|nr:hypothetical protein [Bacteriovorax sp.]
MKRILLPVILVLNFFSTNAFATHAYRSENCISAIHTLNYTGNYPIGGLYSMSLTGQDMNVPALPLWDDPENPNTLNDADVLMSNVESKIIKKGPSSNDCGFDHEEWTSETTIVINAINDDASKKLGLKQGDTLTLICEESTDYPNGSDCN